MFQHGAFGPVNAELGKMIQAVLIYCCSSVTAYLWGLGCFNVVQQFLGEGKSHPEGCRGILSSGHGACRT